MKRKREPLRNFLGKVERQNDKKFTSATLCVSQTQNNNKVLFNFLMPKTNRHSESEIVRILASPKQYDRCGFLPCLSVQQ